LDREVSAKTRSRSLCRSLATWEGVGKMKMQAQAQARGQYYFVLPHLQWPRRFLKRGGAGGSGLRI